MSWKQEDRLLLYCCRKDCGRRHRNEIIEIQRKSLNWDYFLEKAEENGISAIVYSRLNEIKKDCPYIPVFVFEQPKKAYYLNASVLIEKRIFQKDFILEKRLMDCEKHLKKS